MQRSLCFNLKKHFLVNQRKPIHSLWMPISTITGISQENDLIPWTDIISGLNGAGVICEVALAKASQMINSDSKPNDFILVHLTRASTNRSCFSLGQQLHSYIVKSGYRSSTFVSSALTNFYVKFELINEAYKLFVEIPEPSLVSWNSLISGYIHSGNFRKALNLFLQLENSDHCPDAYSFTSALSACGRLGLLQLGESIHSKIVKLGVSCSVIVANCLIDMYGKCGEVEDSIRVFHEMIDRDTISWNSIIAANARNARLEEALCLLQEMPEPDTISYNEVISGIAQFGKIEYAIDILLAMANPNSSSWNSIITGYVNRGRTSEALDFFSKMHLSGLQMDRFTYSSILSGIASLSAITWGILIHCCTVKCSLDGSVVVGSALIDMYSKCGRMNEAERVFQSLKSKNLITWNAMISGHAHNGDSSKVIQLFEQLIKVKDLQPDGITFLNFLSACLHNGVPFEAADLYFQSMIKEYGIDPSAEHCSCMIRIMGREGKIDRAEKMIYELGFESSGAVWRALLSACVTCGNAQIAEVAAAKVTELEGDNEYVFVLMSNVYACKEKWKDVSQVRALMKERNVWKGAGNSRIELGNG